MYTVYAHRFPNGKMYIGMTKRPLKRRFGKCGVNYKHCSAMYRAIQEFGWENVEHLIVLTCENKEDAEKYEALFISKWKTMDPEYGYNIMPGGKVKGHLPEESKRKLSEKNREIWANDPLKRQAAAERMRKRMSDPAYKKRILDALNKVETDHVGTYQNCGLSKKVVQLDRNRNMVKIWDSMSEVQRANIAKSASVSSCCRGKAKSAGGYLWEFYSEYCKKLDTQATV